MLVKSYKTLHYLLFVYIRFVIYSNCKSQAGKSGFFYTQKRKKAGRMKNTKKQKEKEKTLRRLRMARQENGNTPLRTAALHIRGTKTPAGQSEMLWQGITRIRGPLYGFCS